MGIHKIDRCTNSCVFEVKYRHRHRQKTVPVFGTKPMSRYYMELVALKLTKFCTNNLYHGTKYLYHGTYSNLNSFLIPQKQTFGTEILNFTKPAWNRFVQFDCCRFVKLNEFYR